MEEQNPCNHTDDVIADTFDSDLALDTFITSATSVLSLLREPEAPEQNENSVKKPLHSYLVVESLAEQNGKKTKKIEVAHLYEKQPRLKYLGEIDQDDFLGNYLPKWKNNKKNENKFLLAYLSRTGWYIFAHIEKKVIEGGLNTLNNFNHTSNFLKEIEISTLAEVNIQKQLLLSLMKDIEWKKYPPRGIVVYKEITAQQLKEIKNNTHGYFVYNWQITQQQLEKFGNIVKWWAQQEIPYAQIGNSMLNQVSATIITSSTPTSSRIATTHLLKACFLDGLIHEGHNCLSWAWSVISLLHLKTKHSAKHLISYYPALELRDRKMLITKSKNQLEELEEDEERFSYQQAQAEKAQQQIKYTADTAKIYKFYEIESQLKKNYILDQNKWLISHICVGNKLAGHSMLVIEGIIPPSSNSSFHRATAKLFVGYYHLIVPPGATNGMVLCEEYGYHYYQKHYNKLFIKNWPIDRKNADKLIQHIKQQETQSVPYKVKSVTVQVINDEDEIESQSHNCTTWALEQLQFIDINDPVTVVSRLKGLAKPAKETANTSNLCIAS